MQNNPYVGPRFFEQTEHERFFGRDEEIQILAGLALARRAVLFYAQSGAGKSSLLRAGLIPELTREEDSGVRPLPMVYVGRGKEASPAQNIYVQSAVLCLRPDVPTNDAGALALVEALAPAFSGDDATSRSTLLVFDQFEELFTRHRAHWRAREGFFKQVAEALEAHNDLRVLFSMREDFIGDMEPFSHLLPDRLRSRFRMERLKREAAIDAIRLPARMHGCPYEEGVAEALADDLRRARQGATASVNLAEHVEPILLQIVCFQLWNEIPDGRSSITQADVDQHADVDRALISFFEGTVKHVVSATGVGERSVRRFFTESLITPARTRGLVYRGDTTTGGLPNEAIDVLNDDYIIRAETRGTDRYYELSHDRLLEPIRVANDTWMMGYVQQVPLLRQAREWSTNRQAERLLTGESLQEAERWLRASPGEALTPVEQEFLEASRQRQRELNDNRVQRWTNLEDLGWGVIFAVDADPAVKEALRELLEHRRAQATQKHPGYYKECTGAGGYRSGESTQTFLNRHGASFSSSGPDKMPHYLLIVGDPETIPFELQYGLDTRFSVGRIHFDTLEEYARYARSVVTAESGTFALRRELVVWNPLPPDDRASQIARDKLVRPLLEQLTRRVTTTQDWSMIAAIDEHAMKSDLERLLGGPTTPALLFTASHGMGWPSGDAEQRDHQGALLCGDWPGPGNWNGRLPPSFFLSAGDIADDARLLGLVVCMFAEFGAGTPRLDNFSVATGGPARELAPAAFVSRLCQRLLGHPNGGALAVIGHVDVQWTTSFTEGSDGNEGFGLFLNVLDRLMRGHTVGSALEILNTRYAQLASALLDDLLGRPKSDTREMSFAITRTLDARNYIVLGDPAARLPLDGVPAQERPTIVSIAESGARIGEIPIGRGIDPIPPDGLESRATTAKEELLIFNGIDAKTGDYAFPPMRIEELLRLVFGELLDPEGIQTSSTPDSSGPEVP